MKPYLEILFSEFIKSARVECNEKAEILALF